MALLCRTCGEHAVNPRKLFDENGNDILNDILKLTGIWLTNRVGFPSHICASCLQQSNEAMAFRDLCIRTNNLWYETHDADFKRADDAVHMDPLISNDKAPKPDETKEYFTVEIETLCEELKPASPLSHHGKSDAFYKKVSSCRQRNPSNMLKRAVKEQSEKIDNNGEFHDELLDFDPLINEDAELVLDEEDHDEDKVSKRPLSSRKSRLDSCSVPKKGVFRGSRKSDVDPVIKPEKNIAKKRYRRAIGGFCCDQCGKWFKDKSNLNVHLTRHTGVKQFECEECGRKEFTMHLLSLHIRVKHKGELPYTCKYCGQRFDNCIKRLRHERQHKECPDIRPHVCHVCGKAFQLKRALRMHEIVHTGEQPFHCETCDVYFNRKSSLQTHNRSKLHIKKVGQDQNKIQIDVVTDEDT
ncbi:transcription factor Ouib-like [Drosophila persimilis]|uniref:transcription factor Ouib-like n=1 Tax=Drosophila persimilis TaxID=7234 RepID=UPI000F088B66|nr:transcription factor Ouib-like [Drosophila persimilis]